MRRRELDPETEALVLLSETPGVGPVLLMKLLVHFDSGRHVLASSEGALSALGLPPSVVSGIRAAAAKGLEAEKRRAFEAAGISFVRMAEEAYPLWLLDIYDAPPLLYVKGELRPEDAFSVTIVGSRRASREGCEKAYELAFELARNGVTIVSGFAVGVDKAAHEGALDGGGRTLAVLGHGLNHLYPPEHKTLAERVVGSGALISEFPMAVPPRAKNFSCRSRLLSGMTPTTVVVEAPLQSGALRTASSALEQGRREVFVVPWDRLTPRNEGSRYLLNRKGVRPCRSAQEVLEDLRERARPRRVESSELDKGEIPPFLNGNIAEAEALLEEVLRVEPTHVDALIELTGLPAQQVLAALVVMEGRGKVRAYPGNRFARRSSP